jgi:hypothetical protein
MAQIAALIGLGLAVEVLVVLDTLVHRSRRGDGN